MRKLVESLMPSGWPAQVAKSAEACLRPDGVFCAFSPCIEQVQRTCEALASCSFTAPRTMECLIRSYEVGCPFTPPAHHADAAAAPASCSFTAPRTMECLPIYKVGATTAKILTPCGGCRPPLHTIELHGC